MAQLQAILSYQETDSKLYKLERELASSEERKEYVIKAIETDDAELDSFLFSLGCFSGETITVIKRRKSSCIVAIKDGRYNIDNNLANAIFI